MQLMVNGFRSNGIAIFGMVMVILCIYITRLLSLISWSRLYWSFSREGLLPFSRTISRLSSRDSLPLNALFFNTLLTLLISLISIRSYTAINALLSAANLYIISVILTALTLTLLRGRKTFNESRWFNLGSWTGDLIFWIAILWSLFMAVMLCFPLYLPVTPKYMNRSSVVFAGVIAISGIY
jgi:amino acid transporter